MSDGDSDTDFIDLTSDDDNHSELDNDDVIHLPQEITLMVDQHGEEVLHTIDAPRPIDSMDIDTSDPEVSDNDTLGDLDPDDEPVSDDGDDEWEDIDDDEGINQPIESSLLQSGGNGGDPGGDDPGDDDNDDGNDDDTANDDDEDEEDTQRFNNMNPDAELMEALAADGISPSNWNALAHAYIYWRRLFLEKRTALQVCKANNITKVGRLNRRIHSLKEAVREFYAAHAANVEKNRRLVEENTALRARLPDEDLVGFPEPEPLALEDIEASLPPELLAGLPQDVQMCLTRWREPVRRTANLRKTEREWSNAARQFLTNGPNHHYRTWGDIYKLSCREENMSWVFGESTPPKTHPYLKLIAPTPRQEEIAIAGDFDGCTPPRDCGDSSSDDEEDFQPFRFQNLPRKLQLKIFRYVLVFDGEAVHAISRLDPYHEPNSVHVNCNRQISLLHRFHIGREPVSLTFGTIHPQRLLAPLLHIELLWMGSQSLTYEIDEKGKYTSRRTHDLAYLPAACRLKTMAVHIPESSREYMRRKHEPRQIIEYMEELTQEQPNYRPYRALRTLQGLDYVYCLRGLREVTFWDYDKWRKDEAKMPIRDWTFVRDINDCVRRGKSHHNKHFSQIRYLAPIMDGCRPSAALSARIETFVNPPPRQPTGLLSPPPDGLYPQLQTSVDNPIVLDISDDEEDPDTEDDSEAEGSSDEDSGDESDPDDDPDDEDGDDEDNVVATGNIETIDISDDEADNEDEDHGEVGDNAVETTNAAEADRVAMPPPAAPTRGNSREQGTEPSLFMQSATPESPRPVFVQKLETPSSPGTSSNSEGTPARPNREESCLFVGSPLKGDRDSPIDMTEDVDIPSPERQNKRYFASCSNSDDNEDIRYMGSSPKRAKTEDDDGIDGSSGGSGGSGGSSGSGNAANTSSGPFILVDDD
ncbi:hypothetical protein FLAG1_04672 [Fusarium langsethiae]|uniref:Uncharacterized protein n=1 Tax=Fusarium langsethiae TaxID=179993 RepID=A0A0M9EYL8_FUSLA|nr:hypothetical protein FLAG1_04672 [Fusarium langsethiae]GKT98145.1 unnamed protein product [Fusarium langsethiae]GKU19706.1 unnamed protein product [Fusarium langsethiae]